MKTLKTITSLLAGCAITLGSLRSNPAIAQKSTYIQVSSHRTNNGDLLYLNHNGFFNARNGDIAFQYMILPVKGKPRYLNAVTPYCRDGSIDSNVTYRHMNKPGWEVGKNIIIADSPASIALLQTVCNVGYGKIYGE